MPRIVHIPAGTVSGIWGQAYKIDPHGKWVALHLGEKIHHGEQILTSDNGIVRISDPELVGLPFKSALAAAAGLDPVIDDLNRPDPKFATAAGLAGGDGSLNDGMRIGRIEEPLSPLGSNLGGSGNGLLPLSAPIASSAAFLDMHTATATPPSWNPLASDNAVTPPLLPPSPPPSNDSGGQPAPQPSDETVNPAPSLSVSGPATLTESTAFGTYTVTLPHASNVTVTVHYTTVDGTATSGSDYVGHNGVLTFAPGQTSQNFVVPILNDNVVEGPETFSVELSSPTNAQLGASSFTTTLLDNGQGQGPGQGNTNNHAPQAHDDHPQASVMEDEALAQTMQGNVITGSGAGNVADDDVDGDALHINGAVHGNAVNLSDAQHVAAPALNAPLEVHGLYGDLTLNGDGSYGYTLDNTRLATQNLVAGEHQTDVFTYSVIDGHGGQDTATLSITVTGSADAAVTLPPTVAPIPVAGLNGEYYGYNDNLSDTTGHRIHGDDGTATFGGANLNSIEDVQALIDGRNSGAGGSGQLVGSAASAELGAMDAHFHVSTLQYGFDPSVDHDLGNNPSVAAGQQVTSGELHDFLGADNTSLIASTGGSSASGEVGIDTGLGQTSDSAMRMTGEIFLERGNYDFRVTADDGFKLSVGGQSLVEFDGNQYPTTRIFENVEIGDNIDGLQSFELLYWEQGVNARLHVEYRVHGDTDAEWQTMSNANTALFTHDSAPEVFDHRVQDIIVGDHPGDYLQRTGVVLDGDANDNTLTGTDARDVLQGGAGNDHLEGHGGADMLIGGLGDDVLIGGAGADILVGGPGHDRLEGGLGDDIYRLDDSSAQNSDTLIEHPHEGTDTLELGAQYTADVDLHTLAGGNLENVTVQGDANLQIIGNDADNRLSGGAGDNIIDGGAGNDRLMGGQGNDHLTGGAGFDTFEWHLADQGTPGHAAVDVITDFNLGQAFNEQGVDHAFGYSNVIDTPSTGDRLDLRDLLIGEHSTSLDISDWATPDTGNLENYIDISSQNGNTFIKISATGQFADGHATDATTDQVIELQGVDIWTATGVTPGDEHALLQRLIKNGTLVVD